MAGTMLKIFKSGEPLFVFTLRISEDHEGAIDGAHTEAKFFSTILFGNSFNFAVSHGNTSGWFVIGTKTIVLESDRSQNEVTLLPVLSHFAELGEVSFFDYPPLRDRHSESPWYDSKALVPSTHSTQLSNLVHDSRNPLFTFGFWIGTKEERSIRCNKFKIALVLRVWRRFIHFTTTEFDFSHWFRVLQ